MFNSNNYDAEILVVTDPVNLWNEREGWAMQLEHMEHFARTAIQNGFTKNSFAYVNCGPKIPDIITSSKAKTSAYLKENIPQFREICSRYTNLKLIVTMGAWAAHQFAGKQVMITKVRGQAIEYTNAQAPVFHMFAMGYVLAHPGNQRQFKSDFQRLSQLKASNYNLESVALDENLDYQWCTDLEEWLDNPPNALAFDTEGTGLEWYKPEVYPFSLQLCKKAGSAIMIPIAEHYYPELERNHSKLIKQVKQLMGNNKIRKASHNTKYDYHMLQEVGIQVEGPYLDTQQMLFCVDENLFNKSLDEGVRLFVNEMAGYADIFNREVDKSQMIHVEKSKILRYGCSDSDAVYRLAVNLSKLIKKDKRQHFLFENVQMPALITFADTLEHYGVPVDEAQLRALGVELENEERNLYNALIQEVPAKVKRKHLEANKPLSFSRSAFVVDTLFTQDGFGLTPKMFTDSTKKLPDDQKVPKTDAKSHLSYFTDFKTKSGFKFVEQLIEYQKLQKMRGTYVGYEYDEEKKGPTGFWQYLHEGHVRPSYFLATTVTGRTSSRSPNGQNIPKRGKFAKAYRKLFKAPPGWKLIQADYSQAELRIAAWMSNEPTMIQAYKDGHDIHALTGATLSRITLEELMAMPKEVKGDIRYKAKAANFGLIYGVQAPSYKEYAYTQYGLSLTLREAEQARELFFQLYPGLLPWHETMKAFVHENGYVRALHGAIRHLPDIFSKDFWIVAEAERQAINSPVQRFGSDLGVIALTRMDRDLKQAAIRPPIQPRMFIHDANVFMVPDDYVEEALSSIKWYMESNPLQEWFGLTSPIPILADLEVGQNLAELEERPDVIAVQPDWFTCDLIQPVQTSAQSIVVTH